MMNLPKNLSATFVPGMGWCIDGSKRASIREQAKDIETTETTDADGLIVLVITHPERYGLT